MREKLIELLEKFKYKCLISCKDGFIDSAKDCDECVEKQLADYLIANGVVVLPCKLFDIVYLIGLDGTINEYSAVGFCQYPNGVFIDVRYAEKTYSIPIEQVYFSREDAERALKGEKE